VPPHVVSHLKAKLQNWQWEEIYFFGEKSCNVHWIVGLLIKCNSFAESPDLVQQTGPNSARDLILRGMAAPWISPVRSALLY
jgi:hypothetical protein